MQISPSHTQHTNAASEQKKGLEKLGRAVLRANHSTPRFFCLHFWKIAFFSNTTHKKLTHFCIDAHPGASLRKYTSDGTSVTMLKSIPIHVSIYSSCSWQVKRFAFTIRIGNKALTVTMVGMFYWVLARSSTSGSSRIRCTCLVLSIQRRGSVNNESIPTSVASFLVCVTCLPGSFLDMPPTTSDSVTIIITCDIWQLTVMEVIDNPLDSPGLGRGAEFCPRAQGIMPTMKWLSLTLSLSLFYFSKEFVLT